MAVEWREQKAKGLDRPEPVLLPGQTYATIDEKITSIVIKRPLHPGWLLGAGISFALVMLLMYAVTWLLIKGIGIWGVNIPVAWGFAIANFVWWIGIGHAGTLISAILLLLNQKWRTSINRFAEAMTLFAVMCAGMFPLMHLGRPWNFYWLLPYPNTMSLWPQFRSPLVWDCFAVGTYFTVSLLFWYQGLIPDVAAVRDRARHPLKHLFFGILALGWRGSAKHWKYYESAYWLLAALATPLVVSVHSIVSTDFAVGLVPGWHSTFFPPYFVAGAIFSGFAMVLTLSIPLRKFYGLEAYVTLQHLENMGKIMLATGLVVAYSYFQETIMAWYSGDINEWHMVVDRAFGAYGFAFWTLITCNVVLPQTLWWRKARTNVAWLFILSLCVQLGMWTERVVIVVQSLHQDFMPSAWYMYFPTAWDWATLLGTIGFFTFCFFMFIRLLPMISIHEVQDLAHAREPHPESPEPSDAAQRVLSPQPQEG
ncbi:MAG TPA: NrfD/PsrC family molybdoenzyme membrane anchor subunit [Chthonomonadaceae bacterium]|nr:NrfD/PsrC family molybdoenzyme membrane anchor subunit [Chthonomonadaceae bacterium]